MEVLTLTPMEMMVGSLPHSVVAHGWIPFMVGSWDYHDLRNMFSSLQIVTLLALVFSVLYVVWYRSDRPRHRALGTSIIAVLGKEVMMEMFL